MADRSTFSDRLKTAQDDAKVDNRELARRVGVHAVTISQWRSAKQRPDDGTLDRVATALGVSSAWLRYGEPAGRVSEASAKYEERPEAELPRQLEIMALDFEREALRLGADAPFMRYARSRMRDPHLLDMFYKGHEDRPMSAEEQRVEFEVILTELRSVLRRRIERLGLTA